MIREGCGVNEGKGNGGDGHRGDQGEVQGMRGEARREPQEHLEGLTKQIGGPDQ